MKRLLGLGIALGFCASCSATVGGMDESGPYIPRRQTERDLWAQQDSAGFTPVITVIPVALLSDKEKKALASYKLERVFRVMIRERGSSAVIWPEVICVGTGIRARWTENNVALAHGMPSDSCTFEIVHPNGVGIAYPPVRITSVIRPGEIAAYCVLFPRINPDRPY